VNGFNKVRPSVTVVADTAERASGQAGGLRALGLTVRALTPERLPSHLERASWHFAERAAPHLGSLDALVHEGLSWRVARKSSHLEPVIAWSSFALPFIHRGNPVVVVRGSTHIRTQRRILSAGPAVGPSRASIRFETAEYRGARIVTVPTEEIAMDPEWLADAATICVSPYGFPKITAKRWGKSHNGGLRAVFAGEIGWRKGVDRLVRALARQPPDVASFSLFGKRTWALRSWQLPAWWEERGAVSRARLWWELEGADVFVILSREEGMARAGQEALAHGVPVVASVASGLNRWLASGAGVIVRDPDDQDEVLVALATVRCNLEGMRDAAFDVARSWGWIDHARVIWNAFQSTW
jgi:glycosyltransferase involved in cell wall biosynthesis